MTRSRVLTVMLLVVSVAVTGVLLGCGSKETAETETTSDQMATQETHETQDAGQPATEAVDEALAAYDNPQPGICPVCKMRVEKGYVEVASVGEHEYACCSDRCVAMLAENPDKYLTAEEEGHEGHAH